MLKCPPGIGGAQRPACQLTQYGSDGAGRRMEAALSCIAAAHDLGVAYVHTPFSKLEHNTKPSRANRLLASVRAGQRCA